LDAVTSEDLQRTAQELFRTDKLCFALVGPSRKEKRLKKLLSL
jgi:predicted Zn-dependent peptidase